MTEPKPNRKRRKRDNPKWTKFEEFVVPPAIGQLAGHDEMWCNSRYQVGIRYCVPSDPRVNPPLVHLSIKRHDKGAIKGYWRDFQRVKNELCGTDAEAVQLFPSEDRLVDTAKQYHLFCLPPGARIPFGYATRLVSTDEGTAEMLAEVDRETRKLSGQFKGAKQLRFSAHHNATGCAEFGVVDWEALCNKCNALAAQLEEEEGSDV